VRTVPRGPPTPLRVCVVAALIKRRGRPVTKTPTLLVRSCLTRQHILVTMSQQLLPDGAEPSDALKTCDVVLVFSDSGNLLGQIVADAKRIGMSMEQEDSLSGDGLLVKISASHEALNR
jgi:hypothetical protein